jgi:hypothetical protein
LANYANSPLPAWDPATNALTGGIRKLINMLPVFGASNQNNLGQYIPVAVVDKNTDYCPAFF